LQGLSQSQRTATAHKGELMATSPTAPLALTVIQMILAAEPAVVQAIHSLLTGTGTADDLAVLKADVIAWRAIADKAQVEIAKAAPPAVAP